MARGNIYYVTKDKDQDVSFGESNYYDKLESLNIDYVQDQSEESSKVPLEWLKDMLFKMGAAVGHGHSNKDFAFSFRFEETEKMKEDYFRPKLEELKKQAQALTLSAVVRSTPALDQILDNDYGDMVALDEGYSDSLITVDNFIRRIEPKVTYYVYKRVILMH